jgi:hypothetical protein
MYFLQSHIHLTFLSFLQTSTSLIDVDEETVRIASPYPPSLLAIANLLDGKGRALIKQLRKVAKSDEKHCDKSVGGKRKNQNDSDYSDDDDNDDDRNEERGRKDRGRSNDSGSSSSEESLLDGISSDDSEDNSETEKKEKRKGRMSATISRRSKHSIEGNFLLNALHVHI